MSSYSEDTKAPWVSISQDLMLSWCTASASVALLNSVNFLTSQLLNEVDITIRSLDTEEMPHKNQIVQPLQLYIELGQSCIGCHRCAQTFRMTRNQLQTILKSSQNHIADPQKQQFAVIREK